MSASSHDVDGDFLDAVPRAARDVIEDFLTDELRDSAELRDRVRQYMDRVAEERDRFEFLNEPLAEAIAERYVELLERLGDADPEHRRIIQAGLMYFVEPADADDDFDSILGFDDDREVLNTVAEYLDHADLTVDDG
jgi:uncharacterized membrane protein YkvA (DUF1232 family)